MWSDQFLSISVPQVHTIWWVVVSLFLHKTWKLVNLPDQMFCISGENHWKTGTLDPRDQPCTPWDCHKFSVYLCKKRLSEKNIWNQSNNWQKPSMNVRETLHRKLTITIVCDNSWLSYFIGFKAGTKQQTILYHQIKRFTISDLQNAGYWIILFLFDNISLLEKHGLVLNNKCVFVMSKNISYLLKKTLE